MRGGEGSVERGKRVLQEGADVALVAQGGGRGAEKSEPGAGGLLTLRPMCGVGYPLDSQQTTSSPQYYMN